MTFFKMAHLHALPIHFLLLPQGLIYFDMSNINPPFKHTFDAKIHLCVKFIKSTTNDRYEFMTLKHSQFISKKFKGLNS